MDSVQQWPAEAVAVAVVHASGVVLNSHGPQDRRDSVMKYFWVPG